MKALRVVVCALVSSLLLFNLGFGADIASTVSGNWSDAATWSPNPVPTGTDDVTIDAGNIVTVDANSSCNSLTVNGTLQFGSNSCELDVTNGDVLVTGTGTIRASDIFATGDVGQTVSLWGNLTVNGTFTGTVTGNTTGTRTICISMNGSNKIIGATATISIPLLYIYATTTLDVGIIGCNYLRLFAGNLDNSLAYIVLTSSGALYRYAGTMSAEPQWAGNRYLVYGNTSPITSGIELSSSLDDLRVNGNGGVTLDKAVTLSSSIELDNGILTTSGTNLLTLGPFVNIVGGSSTSFVNGPVAQTWTTSTATKTFPIGKGSAYRPLAITLNSPSSPVIQAEVFNSNCNGNKGALNAISTVRYYQTALTSGSATSGGTVMITFDADDGVSDNTSLVVAQSTTANGTYTSLGRSASSATTVTSDGTGSPYNPALGDFLLLGSISSNPLPVELSSFTAFVEEKNVNLQWRTASEVNNYGFDVERKKISNELSITSNWEKVGFVAGAGTSNSAHNYAYTDNKISAGSFAYRLKQIDNNGSFKYSQETQVTIEVAKIFSLNQNYPNPFNPTTNISYQLPVTNYVTLKVFDMLGREVATLVNETKEAGSYEVKWNAANMTSGVYLFQLKAGTYTQTKKLIIMK